MMDIAELQAALRANVPEDLQQEIDIRFTYDAQRIHCGSIDHNAFVMTQCESWVSAVMWMGKHWGCTQDL